MQPVAILVDGDGAVDVPQVLQRDPHLGELAAGVAGVDAGQQPSPGGWGVPFRAAQKHPANAVERIALAAAVAQSVVLHPAADLIHGAGEQPHDVKRVQHRGGVTRVSVPEHLTGGAAMFITLASGMASLLDTGGVGFGYDGRYWEDFSYALGKAIKTGGDQLPPTVKIVALTGQYVNKTFFGSFYGRAKSFKPVLRRAFDNMLADVDVIVMPTASHYAHRHDPTATMSGLTLRGWDMVRNTGSFDVTGHPALNIPAAEADGLPVGLMVVGRHFADDRLLSLARTYERA